MENYFSRKLSFCRYFLTSGPEFCLRNNKNYFLETKKVSNAYKLFDYRLQTGNSNELITEPFSSFFFFNNERIKVGNKMVTYYRNCFEKNVHCIANLLGPTGIPLTFSEFKQKYDCIRYERCIEIDLFRT